MSDLDRPLKDYNCRYCHKLQVRYGSFRSEFPEYKELRTYGIYKPDELQVARVADPRDPRATLCFFVKARCDSCGQWNVFNVVVRDIPGNVRLPDVTKIFNEHPNKLVMA